jgi:hypothetical protein
MKKKVHRIETKTRVKKAIKRGNEDIYENYNKDYFDVDSYQAMFSKSLNHDVNGIVDKKQFKNMVSAIFKNPSSLDKIKYPGSMRLVNPSAVWSVDYIGPFKTATILKEPPLFRSDEVAGEMVELYWMSLLRDVKFSEWNNSELVKEACEELNKLKDFKGPKENCVVTPQTLFRGTTSGDVKGHYVSQFLYHSYRSGAQNIQQKYDCYQENHNPVTTPEDILSIQNGTPVGESKITNNRYILSIRDGATYVHYDTPVTCGINALNVLLTYKCPLDNGLLINNEYSFVNLGMGDFCDLVVRATHAGLLAAWYHKWTYLRCRPEVFSYRIQNAKDNGNTLKISNEVLKSKVLEKVYEKQGNYILSQMYPEGSPCHPAYPAGHATFAGAVCTVLKALFDEDFELDEVVPNEDGSELIKTGNKVKVGDELDKLASNIAIFRDGAGVHYRTDADGIELGEQVAIKLLEDHIKRYPKNNNLKMSLKKRNGEKVTLSNSIYNSGC